MQTHTERRTGNDRRQFNGDSARRWNEIPPASITGTSDDPYDPYDPYWEPVKGQDDD